ncbi:RNA-directed DNA polymerase, eukaryota, reverse transcriptase zinc-binding domain protein [Tanacetum coccineum]
MVNEVLILKYPMANATFLPYLVSDHSPVLITFPQSLIKSVKPFRFANYIGVKEEFLPTVKKEWNTDIEGHSMFRLVNKLNILKTHMNKLNWKNGNLYKRVEEIKDMLKLAQAKLDADPHNNDVKKVEVDCLKVYNKAVCDEEKFLFQKLKIEWMSCGYRNSKYFHKIVKSRQHSSRILCICDEKGNKYEGKKMAEQFVNHFKEFLSARRCTVPLEEFEGLFGTRLNEMEAADMICAISDKEIKESMFDIGENKALGPDGYSSVFFKAWPVVGEDIMVCVTTAKFTINVNGERHGYFTSGRGLRQRDPMSPYLFTLVMEVLTLLMMKNTHNDPQFRYHKGCKELKITHLCFADDLLVLCHGDANSVRAVKRILEEFSNVSGLIPSINKSTIFFGNVDSEEKQKIIAELPFNVGRLPLGVPLNATDSICIDLNSYLFILPKSVVKDIDKVLKGFLWCKGELRRGKAKVSWTNICKPKSQGGLGLKPFRPWNEVLIMKNLWNIVSEKNSLWALQVPMIDNERDDDIKWKDITGNLVNFSVKDVWEKRRQSMLKGRLQTQDRVAVWNSNNNMKCPLCNKTNDSHTHLFFECEYSDMIWKALSGKMKVDNIPSNWSAIIDHYANSPCNNSIWSVVRRIALATVVYFVWKERNNRLFTRDSNKAEVVLKMIIESIRTQMMGLKVRRTNAVVKADDIWDVRMNYLGN